MSLLQTIAPPADHQPVAALTTADVLRLGQRLPSSQQIFNRILIERPTVNCVYPGETAEPVAHRWERRMFGLSAPEVAAILMESWKFPPDTCNAVRHHLEPLLAPAAPVEACLLNLAGWVAAHLGKGLRGEADCWQLTPAKFQRTGLTEEMLDECAQRTQTAFMQIKMACR